MTKHKQLKPIRESQDDWLKVKLAIIKLFRKEIYLPLIRELGITSSTIKNSTDDLLDAIRTGQIVYYRGHFTGRFNATLSRELRRIGAEWDRKQGSWKVPQSKLSIEMRNVISGAKAKFEQMASSIDKKISEFIPAEIAEKLKVENIFDTTLWKTEKKFQDSVRNITIAPELSDQERRRIATEYTQNLQLYIRDFAENETANLRKNIQAATLAGFRRENLAKEIEASYEVSKNKAKFLARQETTLMMTKYAQVRFQDAGVNEYKWNCVNMPHQAKGAPYRKGDVRHDHGILDGKIFSWDDPPIVNKKGERKNPGQDYNCRCIAIPVVKF